MNGEQIVQMMPPPMMVVNPNQQIMQQQPQMHAHQGGPYHQMPQFQMQTQQVSQQMQPAQMMHQQQQQQQHQQQQQVAQAAPHQQQQQQQQQQQPQGYSTTNNQTNTAAPVGTDQSNNSKKTPKEKTPMCQVNEIAKFNKLQPKYVLDSEEGPPHHKTFTVILELGSAEKYTGTGTSIKKAQHSAAKKVIDNCETLDRPKYKPKRPKSINMDALTPTVKLNGLAMKRGEMAIYKILDRKPMYNNQQYNSQFPDNMPQLYPNNNQAKRGSARLPKLFVVELQVGDKIYTSEGRTRQQAKHEAALAALEYYEKNPAPEKLQRPAVQLPPSMLSGNVKDHENQPKKSEVSLVYELALKRNLHVHFEKVTEEGPPHLKHYCIKLTVGKQQQQGEGDNETDGEKDKRGDIKPLYFQADGQAQSKKLARRKAAIVVLEEMKKVIEAEEKEKPQQGRNKKKPSLVKEKEEAFPDLSLHPVSRLAQIQQAAKEREPIYQVISERSVARKKEFVMQCSINDKIATGMGPNKKTAKKNAAENMLRTMGHEPSIDAEEQEGGASASSPAPKEQPEKASKQSNKSAAANQQSTPAQPPTAAAPTGAPSGGGGAAMSMGLVAESQLQYLASLQGYKVTYTDFPKDGKILSLISIDTKPPLVVHGDAPTVALAHEEAATQALKVLMTRGLGN